MVQLPTTTDDANVEQEKSSIFVLAEKSEQVQLEQLKQFYTDRGVNIAPSPGDAFNSLKEILSVSGASFLTQICQGEREAEMVLNSIFSLIGIFPIEEAKQLVEKFGQMVTSDAFQGQGWTSHSGVAVKVLSNLFNFYANHPEVQSLVFKYLLEMAGRAHLTSFVDTDKSKLDSLFKKWHLPTDQQRELLRLLHSALLVDQRHKEAAEVMTSLLCTYTDADAAAAREDAKECVRTAVIDSQSFSLDHLPRLSAVRQLEKTDPLMWKVLDIFANKGLREYKEFTAKNPDFVERELKADGRVLEKKIKMLTLISLAEDSQELPLEKVGQALGIANEGKLEEFIIDAIQLDAIGGKINGVKRLLTVHAFQYRNFQRPQWELLRDRLQSLLAGMKRAHHHIVVTNHSDEV